MKRIAGIAVLVGGVVAAHGQIAGTITALSGFGLNGDGLIAPAGLAPNSITTGTTNNTRGIAFNPLSGNVLVATREGGNAVHILNASTGVKIGNLNMTGVAGGSGAALTAIRVSTDGRIYLCNLTTNATTSAFRIYRWDNEAAAPVVVYSGAPLAGARIGDSLDLIGSGANTRLVAGYGSTPSVTGNNGYAVFNVDAGNPNNLIATHYGFPGTTPGAGDFRLGLTFLGDTDTILGTQGSSTSRLTSIAGGTATFIGSRALTSATERGLDFTVIDGVPVLATMDTVSNRVRIYNMTGNVPSLLTDIDIFTPDVLNTNATVALSWGNVVGQNARLYAVNTNNGVQAFSVTVVPEPMTFAAPGLGLAALARRRRGKSSR